MNRLGLFVLLTTSITALPSQDVPPLPAVSPSAQIKPFIIGGNKARDDQFPWQVGVLSFKGSFCGGSLISDQWILTAAHCVEKANFLQILDCFIRSLFRLNLGLHCFQEPTFKIILGSVKMALDGSKGVLRNSKAAITHPNYDSVKLLNDVALIQMASKVDFNATILPISLSPDAIADGSQVTVSGWGKTTDASTSISYDLNFVQLTTISRKRCAEFYGMSVNEGTVCANGTNTDSTCQGDSGGPLVLYSGSTVQQVGIVSFVSAKGCEFQKPSGYAGVAHFLPWIKATSGI